MSRILGSYYAHRSVRVARNPGRCRSWSSSVDPRSLYGSGWDAGPRSVRVAVWWDFEDCDIPAGIPATNVGNNIVAALRTRGFQGPVSIDAYGDTWQLSRSTQEALASTGISLHHLPSSRKNSSSDRTLMVDLVLWTMDHPPPAHLFIISTDSDLSSPLHSLRMKNYNVLLACNSHAASPALLAVASSVWQWNKLARGEGLVAQTIAPRSSKDFSPDNFDASSTAPLPAPPPFLTPPPPPSPAPLYTSTSTPPSSLPPPLYTSTSTPPLPPPPPLYTSTPPLPPPLPPPSLQGTQDKQLDDFHKDICVLLQQAASSLNQKPVESMLSSVRKELQAAKVGTRDEDGARNVLSPAGEVPVSVRAKKTGLEKDSSSNDLKQHESSRPLDEEPSSGGSTVGAREAGDKVAKEVATTVESPMQQPTIDAATVKEENAGSVSRSCSPGAVSSTATGDGKWTWRKFFFRSKATSSQENSDQPERIEENAENNKNASSASASKLDGETSNQSTPRRFWNRLWRVAAAGEEDNGDNAWDTVKEFLKTEEATSFLFKSSGQMEFTRLLHQQGPLCIRKWEVDKVSELVERLVLEKEIDASIWKLDTNHSQLKTEEDIQAADYTAQALNDQPCPWETIKGHYPNLEELRIWMVYFLNVEQERRSFDVSHLKAEFKKHFGLSLNLSVFGCLRIKDLLGVMQDIVHVYYPKATVCMIRTKTAPRMSKVNPLMLSDYAPLLEELLLEHPDGIPMSMIKARFYSKFNCDIDHQKLGYSRVDKFLRAARKDIYARLDSVEHSVYVLIRRPGGDSSTSDEEDEEADELLALRRARIIVDKEISL